ncbi:MAG: ferrous iron transport protein A [Oscillospiraceae bacterium]|nr:ferrous iron transport protein A [Oscillospiraceae bacterium]
MNERIISLNRAPIGKTVKIKYLSSKGSIRRRLLDIGLIEGTNILSLYKGPSGDPTAYLVRGAVIAIREDDSSNIFVEIVQ